jgi:hypothetical protein
MPNRLVPRKGCTGRDALSPPPENPRLPANAVPAAMRDEAEEEAESEALERRPETPAREPTKEL